MKFFLDKKKRLLKVAVFLLLSFLVFTAHYGAKAGSRFGSLVVSVFAPFQRGVSYSLDRVSTLSNRYLFLVGVEERLHELERENLKILADYTRLQERLLKYRRVSKFLAERDEVTAKEVVMANVIGFDHSNWSRVMIIDKGGDDKITINSNVVTSRGLVGRIVEITPGYSKVMLITDARSSVDALVQRSRDRGIVAGVNQGYCEMNYFPIDSDVREGDIIISSGMGGVVQKGLIIGKVIKVSDDGVGLFKNVRIAPSTNLNRLEEVFVSLGSRPLPWN